MIQTGYNLKLIIIVIASTLNTGEKLGGEEEARENVRVFFFFF